MESTGDAKNLDQAIVHIEGNLDYLKSARNFLVSAKGEYDLEAFRRAGFLTDLFRHSSVGRAREMVHGADRNLQLAQTQLCCVKRFGRKDRKLLPESGSYHLALVPFVEALYEDLFVHTQIQLTIQVVEAALADNLKTLGMLEAKREELLYELERIDTARTRLFQKMGAGQRVEMAM